MNNDMPLFVKIKRKEPPYRPIAERVKDYKAVELRLRDVDLVDQARRCMNCGTPFCHGFGCPLRNVIPEMNDAVRRGFWEKAFNILCSTNPFPDFTGRICPAPCEAACVVGINDDPVSIRQIELAVSDKSFERGYCVPTPPTFRRREKIAIIGSGPSGLSAAYVLNKNGYNVVVFENASKAGGILRYGIPDFKLEKWVVDRRIQLMTDEGITFETNVEIGKDISHRYLASRFNAVLLTGGARKPRDINVPGRDLCGIYFAMQYLSAQNRVNSGEKILSENMPHAKNKKVLVIGGGDTGADCVGTAIRQGAASVTQIEILPKPPITRDKSTPWPNWPLQLRESSSHKEGCNRLWGVTVKRFEGDASGNVKMAVCCEVEWRKNGTRYVPEEKNNTEFVIDTDLILLAMGFSGHGDNSYIKIMNIDVNEKGFIKKNQNYMTNVKGIFVAGDMTQGPSLVVRAIADGIEAAKGIMNYLTYFEGNK